MSFVKNYTDEFQKNGGLLPDAPWLLQARKTALEHCQTRGLPGPKDENWQNLKLSEFGQKLFVPPSPPAKTSETLNVSADTIGGLGDTHQIKMLNGHLLQMPDALVAESKIDIMPLDEALSLHENLLKKYLTTVTENDDPFFDLNTAFASQGLFILLKKGFSLDKPLQILMHSSGENMGMNLRHMIYCEEGASATVIEAYAGDETSYWMNVVTEVFLESGANLDLIKIQDEGANAFHTASLIVRQMESSHFKNHLAQFGSILSRQNVRVDLAAPNAECVLKGFYWLDGKRQADHHIRVDHTKPNCHSMTAYNGVMDDESRGIFRGLVMVHPHASKTEAQQSSHNLLLSSKAVADPKPQLEIYHDDVKCSHGATVGQLDEDALFYLRSRGIPEELAEHLLIRAFLGRVFESLDSKLVRDYLNNKFKDLMPDTAEVGEAL